MGIGIGSASHRNYSTGVAVGNPNPSRFKVEREWVFHGRQDVLVLRVRYPDATNYEGVKLLVYVNFNSADALLRATRNQLDPHFQRGAVSPVARFEPTMQGEAMAKAFAELWARRFL